jgi:hypothetical protein
MKRAFSILAMGALLVGCARHHAEYSGSSGPTVYEQGGYDQGAPTRNPDIQTDPGPMHSSEQFPGSEPLPSEENPNSPNNTNPDVRVDE